jgi:hypothetical protein
MEQKSLEEQIAELKKERMMKKEGLMAVPDPTVLNNHCPVKAMVFYENLIILGTDLGEVRVVDKESFDIITLEYFLDAPILKI